MMGYDLAVERSYTTQYQNSTFLPLLLMTLAGQKHTPKITERFNMEYDYIVVGAGAAGSVVASRLSEKECVSVLLIEAGKPPPLLTDLPAVANQYIGSDLDWSYISTPQKHTASLMKNRKIGLPAGKAVGGSTIINAMFYVRGNMADYDSWAKQGATGWSYNEVLPFFIKMEDNKNTDYVNSGFHGDNGPLTVEDLMYDSKLRKTIRQAAKEKGFKFVDANGENQIGFYNQQTTMREQQRCSSAKAYLVPAENRTNLHILANAFARKIITKKNICGDIEARKVVFSYKGKRYRVKARKEIILSAGAIGSPKILMLSGIGPKENLEALGIPVVLSLPVGRNLQDHPGNTVLYVYPGEPVAVMNQNPSNINQYISTRTGPLTDPIAVQYSAFMAIDQMNTVPDYKLLLAGSALEILENDEAYTRIYTQNHEDFMNKTLFGCYAYLLKPESRGTLNITSKNPHTKPAIDPNYLAQEKDVTKLAEGMKMCDTIANTTAMRSIGVRRFTTKFPGCENYADDPDQNKYFRCILKSSIYSGIHYSGTAKMGHQSDPTTVVDPELRVKGIKRLRVVDASIMPSITRGNTMIPTMMIAEKASYMIGNSIHCPET